MLIQCYYDQVPVSEDGPQPVHPESERGGHHDRLHAPHLPRQPLLRGARHRGAGGTGILYNHLVICVHACFACPWGPWCSDSKFPFHFLINPLIIPVWTENYLKDLEESPYTASH